MTNSLVHDLDVLHAGYVSAVNNAVADGDLALAEELAAGYEHDAIEMMAAREGLEHLLPLRRVPPRSRLRTVVARALGRAA
ncbi:hypothetical protein GCM10011519_02380 [Marmoricola endophyticus]|uniref:Uncharacterized protein n=1 Tax=Marmoricola endophyticus TaxID=2040280 RepID=A0A917F165_9ACTN|nr:hypothetical protein [Marmoricola endophyticus]GGF32503.1 hypothetical protein GCM10011519_02380 [Marmoricola endophyticus]